MTNVTKQLSKHFKTSLPEVASKFHELWAIDNASLNTNCAFTAEQLKQIGNEIRNALWACGKVNDGDDPPSQQLTATAPTHDDNNQNATTPSAPTLATNQPVSRSSNR